MVEEFGHTRSTAKRWIPRGWSNLVDRVFDVLELLSTDPSTVVPRVTSIKEKYGYLSITTNGSHPDLEKVIDSVESESERTCQECGAPATTVEKNSWIYTLCEKHA